MNPTVFDIVRNALQESGYSALCNDWADGCGCSLDELMPCREGCLECRAAYWHKREIDGMIYEFACETQTPTEEEVERIIENWR